MKKVFFIIIALFIVRIANAQWHLGGSSSIWYSQYEGLSITLLPDFGYEINDKIAVGGIVGAEVYFEKYAIGIFEPYVRYTPWHNDKVFIDLKGVTGVGIGTEFVFADLGVVPSLRVRIIDNLDLFTNLGFVGASYNYNTGLGGGYKASSGNLAVGVIYRFANLKNHE